MKLGSLVNQFPSKLVKFDHGRIVIEGKEASMDPSIQNAIVSMTKDQVRESVLSGEGSKGDVGFLTCGALGGHSTMSIPPDRWDEESSFGSII